MGRRWTLRRRIAVALGAMTGAGLVAVPAARAQGHPDWSPDGTLIAFEAGWAGSADVYVATLDGSSVRRLTDDPAMQSYPRFAPDGKTVVYLMRAETFSMHRVRVDGGVSQSLLGPGNLEPAFSPDGRSIAFRSYLGGRDPDGEIVLLDLEEGRTRRLTDNEVEDGFPSFGPEGRYLYFHRAVGSHRQIVRRDLETGEEAQLTDGAYDSWHAHASPRGDAIVFDSERHGHRDIFLMELPTGSLRRLTDHPGRDGYPKFSPDGRRVAFHSDRLGERRIFVLDLETGEVAPLPLESAAERFTDPLGRRGDTVRSFSPLLPRTPPYRARSAPRSTIPPAALSAAGRPAPGGGHATPYLRAPVSGSGSGRPGR